MKSEYMKAADGDCKAYYETVLAVQEWGVKNEMRLFGITIAEYGEPGKTSELKPRAKAYFADTGVKNMMIIFFDIKETGGKVTVSKSKAMGKGTKWPIKIARTKNFQSDSIDTVAPLYWVLLDRGIILPFKSTLKTKEWAALPFEDMSGIKSTEITDC